MTFRELLSYVGAHSRYAVLDGDLEATLEKTRAGSHRNPLAAQILAALDAKLGSNGPDAPVERAAAINALGPLRLAFMRDDAPVQGFRLIEEIVYLIDGAFNDEAQRTAPS